MGQGVVRGLVFLAKQTWVFTVVCCLFQIAVTVLRLGNAHVQSGSHELGSGCSLFLLNALVVLNLAVVGSAVVASADRNRA